MVPQEEMDLTYIYTGHNLEVKKDTDLNQLEVSNCKYKVTNVIIASSNMIN